MLKPKSFPSGLQGCGSPDHCHLDLTLLFLRTSKGKERYLLFYRAKDNNLHDCNLQQLWKWQCSASLSLSLSLVLSVSLSSLLLGEIPHSMTVIPLKLYSIAEVIGNSRFISPVWSRFVMWQVVRFCVRACVCVCCKGFWGYCYLLLAPAAADLARVGKKKRKKM